MSWSFDAPTRERLHTFLREHDLADEEPRIAPIGDGHSNLTFRLDTGGRCMVLRRPPPPPFPPGSNDVLREAGFLRIVGPHGVPVPGVLATAEAGAVFDVPFYIMDMVDGVVVTETLPAAFTGESVGEGMAGQLVSAMAQLHGIDWSATPLAGKARPEAFNARHLRIFARMLDDGREEPSPAFREVAAWLEGRVPEPSGAAIIHNDMRLGNVMWSGEGVPRLVAILDWELATVGDPLLDLAYLACSLPREGACHTPVQDLAAALLEAGCPEPQTVIARYFAQTGGEAADIRWYQAMVNFKLAALYRYSRLAGHDSYFADPTHEARFLAEAAHYCRD